MIKLEEIEAASWLDGSKTRLFEQWRADRNLDPLDCSTPVEVMYHVERLEQALICMMEEKIDYMTINHLGDPEQTHSVQLARAALKGK